MSGLQETFYIMGIIFMALMFLLTIVLVMTLLIIRSKIVKIHDAIDHRLDTLAQVAEKGGELSAMASSAVFKSARKALKKAKK
jgi:Na+-transporting methylmalonyl-CoA/oxaloacetate decarboxylase gamma subunit